MTPRREPFSWDGDDEQPVPLDDRDFDPSGTGSSPIVGEAESVVRDAKDAIAREDTDPAISLPIEAAEPSSNAPSQGQGNRVGRPLPRRVLKISLVASCLLAFAHGWTMEASAGGGSPPDSCDAAHCRLDTTSNEWKEEQRP